MKIDDAWYDGTRYKYCCVLLLTRVLFHTTSYPVRAVSYVHTFRWGVLLYSYVVFCCTHQVYTTDPRVQRTLCAIERGIMFTYDTSTWYQVTTFGLEYNPRLLLYSYQIPTGGYITDRSGIPVFRILLVLTLVLLCWALAANQYLARQQSQVY